MKNFKAILGFSLFSVAILACGPKGQTLKTTEAKDIVFSDNATSIAVNTSTSQVTWMGFKPGGKHNGTISIRGGAIMVEGEAVVGGNFIFDINSLAVLDIPAESEYNGKLKGHLMSADFFDAANFPNAIFEITGAAEFNLAYLEADKDEYVTENTPSRLSEIMVADPTHFISGNLTMRGTTKNITFPARVTLENGVIKAKANFNIDRTDWGLKFKDQASLAERVKDDFIYNTVNVGFELEASSTANAEASL